MMTPEDLDDESFAQARAIPDASAQARAILDAIAEARSEHLTYEQMDAWVEDEMDQTARELVMAHIGLCAFCAKQLRAYESYAPVMSAPVAGPAQLVPFGERFRASLFFSTKPRWPQLAMIALAIAVAALAPAVIRNARSSGRLGGAESLQSLESLPSSLREGAREVVTSDMPLRPAALKDLTPSVDPQIEYPASEVIEETQPELRWKPFAASYSVLVSDRGGKEAAHATELPGTHWTISTSLIRGAIYTWEVRASGSADLHHTDAVHQAGAVHKGMFRVLGDSEEQTLAQLRASGAGPLALGAVAQQFGLLSMAQREFEKLAKDLPRSQDAEKLLEHVTLLRGR
jgi:hypothetical protein